jgi:predicted transcriptional regulator
MTYSSKELASVQTDPVITEARHMRRRLNRTQKEFAALCGITKDQLGKLELGKYRRAEAREQKRAKVQVVLERWREEPPPPNRSLLRSARTP